jgi:hypothetical protein
MEPAFEQKILNALSICAAKEYHLHSSEPTFWATFAAAVGSPTHYAIAFA